MQWWLLGKLLYAYTVMHEDPEGEAPGAFHFPFPSLCISGIGNGCQRQHLLECRPASVSHGFHSGWFAMYIMA